MTMRRLVDREPSPVSLMGGRTTGRTAPDTNDGRSAPRLPAVVAECSIVGRWLRQAAAGGAKLIRQPGSGVTTRFAVSP